MITTIWNAVFLPLAMLKLFFVLLSIEGLDVEAAAVQSLQ